MKIHEYQAKEIFTRYAIPVTREILCYTTNEVLDAVDKLALDIEANDLSDLRISIQVTEKSINKRNQYLKDR